MTPFNWFQWLALRKVFSQLAVASMSSKVDSQYVWWQACPTVYVSRTTMRYEEAAMNILNLAHSSDLIVQYFHFWFLQTMCVHLQIGAVLLNGRGDGDVRIAIFLPKSLADQVSYVTLTHVYVSNKQNWQYSSFWSAWCHVMEFLLTWFSITFWMFSAVYYPISSVRSLLWWSLVTVVADPCTWSWQTHQKHEIEDSLSRCAAHQIAITCWKIQQAGIQTFLNLLMNTLTDTLTWQRQHLLCVAYLWLCWIYLQRLFFSCSEGNATAVKRLVKLPGLDDHVRQAACDLLDNTKQFYPVAGWTYLARLYGPSVRLKSN